LNLLLRVIYSFIATLRRCWLADS